MDRGRAANPIYTHTKAARARIRELAELHPGLVGEWEAEGSEEGELGHSLLYTAYMNVYRDWAVSDRSAMGLPANTYLLLRHHIEAEEAVLDAEEGLVRKLGCLACTAKFARRAGLDVPHSDLFDALDGAHADYCTLPDFHLQLLAACDAPH